MIGWANGFSVRNIIAGVIFPATIVAIPLIANHLPPERGHGLPLFTNRAHLIGRILAQIETNILVAADR